MQVKMNQAHAFNSFDLTITVESQDEASQLFALLNHATLQQMTPNITHDDIKKNLTSGCGGSTPNYIPVHNKICGAMKS